MGDRSKTWTLKDGKTRIDLRFRTSTDANGGCCGYNSLSLITVHAYSSSAVSLITLDSEQVEEVFSTLVNILVSPPANAQAMDRLVYINDRINRGGDGVGHGLCTCLFAEWLCRNAGRFGSGILEMPAMINKNYVYADTPAGMSYLKTWIWDPTGKYLLSSPSYFYGNVMSTEDHIKKQADLWKKGHTTDTDKMKKGLIGSGKLDATMYFRDMGVKVGKDNFEDLTSHYINGIKTIKL